MIATSITVPVNGDGPAGEEPLTREQIWRGLLMKARDARLFVPGCSACEVIDEGDGYIVREAIINGIALKEIVSLEPQTKVTFHQVRGIWEGIIVNEVFDDESGELQLRFYCLLSRRGAEPGGEEEQRDQAMFEGEKGYGPAMLKTIQTTRNLLKAGELA